MGQKANPICLRLGIIKGWESSWFSLKKEYGKHVLEDYEIRKYVKNELFRAGISQIRIKRGKGTVDVNILAARPGIIMGKSGVDISFLKDELEKRTQKKVAVNVSEEKNPEMSARLLGELIAGQIEKRVPFRRAMKLAVQRAMKAGAYGIRVNCSGRLGGVEIARREWYREGRVPLHTLRADMDYAFTEALTTYGKIGIKVWIYRGEVLKKEDLDAVMQKELCIATPEAG